MKKREIRVLMCPANGEPYLTNIQNELRPVQKAVGGYIEVVTISEKPKVILVCNEEGRLMGLPLNKSLPNPQLFGLEEWNIVGDCFFCGTRGSEFANLPESLRSQLLQSAQEAFRKGGSNERKKHTL